MQIQYPFKNAVDCVVYDEKVYLTKEDLVLSNTKIENWFTQQSKWLAVVFIASFIGVLSFIVGMVIVKKWFGVRNTVTINTSVCKFAKHLAETISLLNTIRGGQTVSLSDSQKEYAFKIRITWHKIFILII